MASARKSVRSSPTGSMDMGNLPAPEDAKAGPQRRRRLDDDDGLTASGTGRRGGARRDRRSLFWQGEGDPGHHGPA